MSSWGRATGAVLQFIARQTRIDNAAGLFDSSSCLLANSLKHFARPCERGALGNALEQGDQDTLWRGEDSHLSKRRFVGAAAEITLRARPLVAPLLCPQAMSTSSKCSQLKVTKPQQAYQAVPCARRDRQRHKRACADIQWTCVRKTSCDPRHTSRLDLHMRTSPLDTSVAYLCSEVFGSFFIETIHGRCRAACGEGERDIQCIDISIAPARNSMIDGAPTVELPFFHDQRSRLLTEEIQNEQPT